MADDDDLVMESTTDSPEQVAAGLGVDPPQPHDAESHEADASLEEAPSATVLTTEADETQPDDLEEPPAEDGPSRVVEAAPRTPRPQRKTVDTIAAAARRKEKARASVLEQENLALRQRLAELAGGDAGGGGALPPASAIPPALVPPPPDVVVKATDVPDDDPTVKAALGQLAAIGERPKQADFDDFDKFEEAVETWRDKRATARARVELVREDVARTVTAARTQAFHAATAAVTRAETLERDARQRYADYDAVMAAARTDTAMQASRELTRALVESPLFPDLKYYLAKNKGELQRINSLPTSRQLAELGKLESRIEAALASGQTGTRQTRPATRVTRAPEPASVVLGDRPGMARRRDLNDPTLSLAEYNRLRDQMDVESGRRPQIVALTR